MRSSGKISFALVGDVGVPSRTRLDVRVFDELDAAMRLWRQESCFGDVSQTAAYVAHYGEPKKRPSIRSFGSVMR